MQFPSPLVRDDFQVRAPYPGPSTYPAEVRIQVDSPGLHWLVAEHGMKAGYVRNIAANPRVRLKLRHGLRARWHTGTAQVLPDDDAREPEVACWSSAIKCRECDRGAGLWDGASYGTDRFGWVMRTWIRWGGILVLGSRILPSEVSGFS